MKKLNNKVFVALLSLFILIVGLIAGTALVRRVQEVRERAAPAPNVVISPQSQNRDPNDILNFTVRSDTGTYYVAGVDLNMTYNKDVFEITSVQKGSGLGSFSEWVNEIDNAAGKISYTATTQNLTQLAHGSDVELLVVTGKVKANAEPGNYLIGFDTGTILGDAGGNDIFATTVPGNVTVSQPPITITDVPPTETPTIPPIPPYTGTPTPSTTSTPTPTLPAYQYPDSTLEIHPSSTTQSLGKTFMLDIVIDTGVNETVATEVHLNYNPSIVKVVDITPGTFFSNFVETIKNIDNQTGLLQHVLHIPTNASPVRGTDVLARITFEALSEGTTTLTFGNRTIVAAINLDGRNALRSKRDGIIIVRRASLPGDINDMGTYCGDGVVNILDYTILYEHFWEAPSTHPCADINEDGKVNTLDYVILYENFGRRL